MIATGIKEFLENEGLGTFGDDLFVRQRPEDPDNVIVVYDEPGTALVENHHYDSDMFGSRIEVRGWYDSYVKDKMLDIHRKVSLLKGKTLDGIDVRSTMIQTKPGFVRNDEQGRAIYNVHYEHYCQIGSNKFRTQT